MAFQWKMHDNSLFAVLLRSGWWISFAIAAGMLGIAKLVLPEAWFIYAAFATFPFVGIGAYRAWVQARTPGPARIAAVNEAVRGMSWAQFASELEAAFAREGYTSIKRIGKGPVDFEMTKGFRTALVCGKRWKVSRTGIDSLKEFFAQKDAREANELIYVAAGEVTEQALAYAREQRIRMVHGVELAKLLPSRTLSAPAGKASTKTG